MADTESFSSYSANTYDDELIIVICPGLHGKPPAQYEIHRSALARSPVLASYLESDAYLQGCRIYLKFGEDPAICFHVIKVYLEEGIDRYSKTRLRVSNPFLTLREGQIASESSRLFPVPKSSYHSNYCHEQSKLTLKPA